MERALDDPTDPSDWRFTPLEELDGLLRCSICLEYYRTAMIMPGCSHNYCSLCIRRYLAVRSQCPTCAAPATNSQLRNNRLLDELVEQFTASRKAFMSLVSTHAAVKSKNGLPPISQAPPPQRDSNTSHKRSETRSAATETGISLLSVAKTERESTVSSIGNHPKTDLGRQQMRKQQTASRGSPDRGSSAHVPEPPSLLLLEESILAEETLTSSSFSERRASDKKPRVSSSSSGEDVSGSRYREQSTHTRSEDLSDTSTRTGHPTNTSPTIKDPSDTSTRTGTPTHTSPAIKDPSDTSTRTGTPTHTSTAIKQQLSTSLLSEPRNPNSASRTPSFSAETSSSGAVFSPPSTPKLPPAHRLSIKHEISPVLTPTSSPGCHTPLSASRAAPTPSPSTSTHSVDCPVCGLLVHQRHINSHLNLCLNRASSQRSQRSSNARSGHSLPRLPKLCFNIMNEKQLKSKLREYHLPTHGSRQAMMSRLQEFTLQYNAQCDSLIPKTPQQIAQEVERAEQERLSRRPASQQQPVRKDSTRDQQRKSYEQVHGDHFAKLISEVRKRGRRGRKEETLAGPKAEGIAERQERGGGEGGESGPRGAAGGDGSSDVEIIERGREVLAVDSSESGDEVAESVWAVVSRMGMTSVPESPHTLRQSTRLKRKRYPTTANPSTPVNLPEEDKSHGTLGSGREAALSSDEDPDFVPTTPTTPTFRTKKRLKRK